jgi:hypothetical protein
MATIQFKIVKMYFITMKVFFFLIQKSQFLADVVQQTYI